MAAKKQAAEEVADETTDEPGATRTGVDVLPHDAEILGKSIDERMAALLKDHQAMGARPK